MKKQNAFTLIELMIVVALVAIVAAFATPSARDIVLKSHRTAALRDVGTALALTRSEAINRQTVVAMCTTTNFTSCSGTSTNWEDGFLVFEDDNQDGAVDVDTDIIRIFREFGGSITVRRSMRDGSADTRILSYDETAMFVDKDDASNFIICDEKGVQHASALVLNSTGQVRTAADTNDDNVVEISVITGPSSTSITAQDISSCP